MAIMLQVFITISLLVTGNGFKRSEHMNTTKKEDGLPDIGEAIRQKKSWAVIGVIATISAAAWMYWHNYKVEKPKTSPVEETYTVTNEPQVEIKKTAQEISAQPVANAEKQTTQPMSEEEIKQQIALIQEKQKALQQRLAAPLMLVNTSQTGNTSAITQSAKSSSGDINTQFMNQVSAQTTEFSTATPIGPLNMVIAEGSLIHAILESATNSDLPGYVRASVSEPV